MTCSAGASVAPGHSSSDIVLIDLATYKQLTGQQSTWFDPFLGIFTPVFTTAGTLCSANPADPATPSASDFANAIVPPFTTLPTVLAWIQAKAQYFEFTQVCVCNTQTCAGQTFGDTGWTNFDAAAGAGEYGNYFVMDQTSDCTGAWAHNNSGSTKTYVVDLWDNAGPTLLKTIASFSVPSGTHTFKVWDTGTQSLTAGHTYCIALRKAASVAVQGKSGNANGLTINPYAHYTDTRVSVGATPIFPSGVENVIPAIEPELCNGVPTLVVPPTLPPNLVLPTPVSCSTNGDICSMLNQLQIQVQMVQNLVTTIQRRKVPFAWIAGTPHTGLTGAGDITVQDIIAAAVSVTAHPGGWGATADTPTRSIPVYGSIQASDGTLFDDWRQLHYLSEFFDIPSWATRVHYSLRPGVTITLTPLSPEP